MITLLLFIVTIVIVVLRASPLLDSDDLVSVVFCDVGQGDATLVQMGSVQVLIDGGIDQSVLSCLRRYMPMLDQTIEVVIATHADADHIAGLALVMEKYTTPLVMTNGLYKESADFEAFSEQLILQLGRGAQHIVAGAGLELRWGELKLRVLGPGEQTRNLLLETETQLWDTMRAESAGITDHNMRSIALIVEYKDHSFLLTGDLDEQKEIALIEHNMITPLTLLKAGHHGSKTSSSLPLLVATQPEVVSISAGKNNRYGHPAPEVLARIDAVGAQVVRTDLEGNVHFLSNGRNLWRIH